MAKRVLERLEEKFPGAIKETSSQLGNDTAVVAREHLVSVAEFLKTESDLEFNVPIDCTAVDWQGKREIRFEVVYHLYSLATGARLRLKVNVADDDPTCPSLTTVWPGMNWHERECWDLYGIRFVGHPNLKRILMYEEFVGHPLRKDYPIAKRQPLMPMRDVSEVATQRDPGPEQLNVP